jgi:hypothetical protein
MFNWSTDIEALFNEHVTFNNRYNSAFFNAIYHCDEDHALKVTVINFDEISFSRCVENGVLLAFFEIKNDKNARILKWLKLPQFEGKKMEGK